MTKEEIIKDIKKKYTSKENILFNGIGFYNGKYDNNLLCELIDDNLIEVQSFDNSIDMDTSKKFFDIKGTKESQKEQILNGANDLYIYPTREALKSVRKLNEQPFTSMLLKGEPSLKLLFFDKKILENHKNDPKYICSDYGYSGNILLRDEYYNDKNGSETVRVYGKAYNHSNVEETCIAVFLEDLYQLNSKKQLEWKSYLLDNQDEYQVTEEFIRNQIIGEFVETYSIYDALLAEMIVINNQSLALGLPLFFHRVFDLYSVKAPHLYKQIVYPTKKNYDDFVEELEKIIVDNINKEFFLRRSSHVLSVQKQNDDGSFKGTLVLLSEWLKKNIRIPNDAKENTDTDIVEPLKKLRKLRQNPAHKILLDDELDQEYVEQQKKLMLDVYEAIRNIRLIFSNHNATKDVVIPEYLKTGKGIKIY